MRFTTNHGSGYFLVGIAQLGLILVLSSCRPQGTANPALTIGADQAATDVPPASEVQAIPSEVVTSTAPVASPTAELRILPTSRGPTLEATDPTTVTLAAGQLQLIEFFRFT